MITLNEQGLVQKLEAILKREFNTDLSFREFSAGYGIADLVFAVNVSFSTNKIDRTPITNFCALQIFLTLRKNTTYCIDDIENIFTAYNRKYILKQLNFLIRNRYIYKNEGKFYIKKSLPEELSHIKKLVAIEVKLTDHKNGLIQAKRYQYFADKSYLAILKNAEKNIDFAEFDRNNIGLILFDDKSETLVIKHPSKKNIIRKKNIHSLAKELILSRLFTSSF